MKDKILPVKPFLLLLYGYPGSGKTTFARRLAEEMAIVHLQTERFQHEIHEATSGQASGMTQTLLEYMTKEFLRSGVSVALDTNVTKKNERQKLRKLAKDLRVQTALVWIQIDPESAFGRTQKRDRRKSENKYAAEYSSSDFQRLVNESQNPVGEDYVVISGKHTFHTQRRAVMKKLYELGLLSQESATQNLVKPELVNLIPKHFSGRGEFPRRNISIR